MIWPPATSRTEPGARIASPCEAMVISPPFKLRSSTLWPMAAISPLMSANGVPCRMSTYTVWLRSGPFCCSGLLASSVPRNCTGMTLLDTGSTMLAPETSSSASGAT